MNPRACQLIEQLHLAPHPEGGYYRRIVQSDAQVIRPNGDLRLGLTSIYFLLLENSRSRWHSVCSDEVWHYYEGAVLELLTVPPRGGPGRVDYLGPLSTSSAPVHGVPAGWWQAARTLGTYTLAGCTVGPGFEFCDFSLLAEDPRRATIEFHSATEHDLFERIPID